MEQERQARARRTEQERILAAERRAAEEAARQAELAALAKASVDESFKGS